MNEKKLIDIAKELYRNSHSLFGFEHGYKVMRNAKEIIKNMNPSKIDLKVVFPAALFHDVAFDNNDCLTTHSLESVKRIGPVLRKLDDFSEEEIKLITRAMSRHSRYAWPHVGKPETLEEKVVYDSDQIEWLNVQGILKYAEISRFNGKTYEELRSSLPKNIVKRYNGIFLTATKMMINKEFLEVMNILNINPMDYLERPEVFEVVETSLPSKHGAYRVKGYLCNFEDTEALAVIKGDIKKNGLLVRVHSECLTGEVLYSERCDCRIQLKHALQLIERLGEGIVVYLRQEGRGIGLINKLKAYHLQDNGFDTINANIELGFEVDKRDYRIAALILDSLGINNIKLITNSPDKINGLQKYGINIKERIPTEKSFSQYCEKYLETKKKKMGHLL